MSSHLNFYAQSTFLCEHKAIKAFVQNYLEHYKFSSPQRWSIVCERREDIVAIRNQIFIEIERLTQKEAAILNGISIYTLDTLAQKICSTLSHIEDLDIRKEVPHSLFKPYLDITSQEKLAQIVLNLLGYNSSDSLSLSKQILTLVDTQLPPDSNFMELILATQEQKNTKSIQHISEISLRQILAALQQTKIELSEYARFQTFVTEYLNQLFLDHLQNSKVQNALLLTYEIFSSPILWFSAPEYLDNTLDKIPVDKLIMQNRTHKPGNFQSYLVNDFKNGIIKIRELLSNFEKINNSFYDARTILTPPECTKNNSINVFLSTNDHHFLHSATDLIIKNNKDHFVMLADLDPQSFQSTQQDGAGDYSITRKDLENWKNLSTNSSFFSEIKLQIDEKYKNFLETLSYIQNFESLNQIAQIYSLKRFVLNEETSFELFALHVLKEKITIGNVHPLHEAPKVLSFFNSCSLPQKMICIGRPHNIIPQSFNVKILNQVFMILKQRGIEVEIPASEMMYNSFWKHMLAEIKNIDFWLSDKSDLERFPNFVSIKNILSLNNPIPTNFDFHFQTGIEINIPDWKEKFSWQGPCISITQFEDYVSCPHKFLLNHVLNIKRDEQINSINFKEIGIDMHKICEQLITRLVTLFGNQGYIKEMALILDTIIKFLKEENIFLSFEKNVWKEGIKEKIISMKNPYCEDIVLAFNESIESIWDTSKETNMESFISLQQREILKRTFLRFLITEFENLNNNKKLKIGLYRELSIQFELAGQKFNGRIDRIDLTEQGLEIIDYKTSNIAKTQKDIVLSPSFAQGNNKVHLNTQGALYSFGFAKSYFVKPDEYGEDELLNKIKYYSLYFLKNLEEKKDNCLKFTFDSPMEKNSIDYKNIEDDYSVYVKKLTQGQFSANPIQGDATCLFCVYKPVCSRTYKGER